MFDTAHIHPMLVHFPIALTLLGVLLSAFKLFKPNKCHYPCGEIILYFATFSAILALIAGNNFTPHFTNPVLHQAKNIHSTFAGITLTLLCVATAGYLARYIFKKRAHLFEVLGWIVYLLAAISVSITGFLGGSLVYNDLLHMH